MATKPTGKKPTGRPPILWEPHVVEKLLQVLGVGGSYRDAAEVAGISYQSLLRRQQQSPSFCDLLARGRVQAKVKAMAYVMQQAATDWRAAAFWLQNGPYRNEWGVTPDVSAALPVAVGPESALASGIRNKAEAIRNISIAVAITIAQDADAPPNLDFERLAAAVSPAAFAWAATKGTPNPYVPSALHLHLAEQFVELAEGRLEVLILAVPVQHGKTETISVYGSAWYLSLHPDRNVIAASYATDFAATRIGLPVRTILERYSPKFFGEGVRLNPSSKANRRFALTAGARFALRGRCGIAGRRADLAIVDDPFPGLREAMSKIYRDQVWNWYIFELLPRLAPKAGVDVIQSRWHDDDLVGRLIRHCTQTSQKFRVVDLPAIALGPEDDGPFGPRGPRYVDALGRKPGEALWPEVRPLSFLSKMRTNVDRACLVRSFKADHSPMADLSLLGNGFDTTRWSMGVRLECFAPMGSSATSPLSSCRIFQLIDPATSTDPSADRFALATWAITPLNDLAIIDMVVRFDAPRQLQVMRAAYLKWRPLAMGVESVGYQLSLVQHALHLGLPVKKFKADRDKLNRAQIIATRYEAGTVYHPRGAPWLIDFEEELVAFPSGTHDDQVDVTSGAGIVLALTGASASAAGVRIS